MDRQQIYVVSGGSGETALRMVQAALTQFSKGESSALVRRFQNVRSQEDLDRVLQMAADKRAVIIHTTVSREMREYLDNGAELGLLVDPLERKVHVYRRDREVEILDDPRTVSCDPTLSGFTLDLKGIWTRPDKIE